MQGGNQSVLDTTTVPIIVGLISAATTSLGWIVLHYFTRKNDIDSREFVAKREQKNREQATLQADRTRRLELRLKYLERQINEFYAPIYCNIQLIWNVWSIGDLFEKQLESSDNNQPLEEIQTRIGIRLGKDFFGPIHDEIRNIIKTKMFLVDGIQLPDSFSRYLLHSVMEDVQRKLYDQDGIKTSSVIAHPWVYEFPVDVKAGLDEAMRAYDDVLQELGQPAATAEAIGSPASITTP